MRYDEACLEAWETINYHNYRSPRSGSNAESCSSAVTRGDFISSGFTERKPDGPLHWGFWQYSPPVLYFRNHARLYAMWEAGRLHLGR